MSETDNDFITNQHHLLDYLYNFHTEMSTQLDSLIMIAVKNRGWSELLEEKLHGFINFLNEDFKKYLKIEDDVLYMAMMKQISTLDHFLLLLKQEHAELLDLSQSLIEEYVSCKQFGEKSARLVCLLKQFCYSFSEHAWKENHALYPLAKQVLSLDELDQHYQMAVKTKPQDSCLQNYNDTIA
ncbi:hemerythrin domain-containing protein [Brevibacillus daliensis]|uniref:hemerythrin domain-containing protein n=1 Tax=Brevibacillus daliensis TaxID=2892995 RepID=UPI001E4391C7|nr:hemerythrin domain-containing protein [Brevibacillus daliensis]